MEPIYDVVPDIITGKDLDYLIIYLIGIKE